MELRYAAAVFDCEKRERKKRILTRERERGLEAVGSQANGSKKIESKAVGAEAKKEREDQI